MIVNGTGFAGAEVVTINLQLGGISYTLASGSSTPLGSFRVLSSSQLEFRTAGSASAGPRDLLVTTNGGNDTLVGAFDYNNGCVSTVSVNAASGTALSAISITGSGFTGMTSVTIGGQSINPTFQNDGLITGTAPNLSGVQTLTVNTNHGSASSTFTYGSGSVFVNPASGTAGVTMQVTGSGFTGLMGVTIGGFAAAATFISDTVIWVTPPSLTGVQTLVVNTNHGSGSTTFTYTGSSTVVVNAAVGTAGVAMQITGSGFTGMTSVTIGGFSASPTFVSDTVITIVPPTLTGVQTLTVNTNHGSGSNTFTYGSGTVVVNSATGAAGVTMQISGSGFTGMTSVTIGGFSASPVFVSDSVITITPPTLTGVQTLTVNTNHGSGSNTFTYGSGIPVVTSVSPTCGPTGGGTLVTVTGSGFIQGGTTVLFGVNSGSSVSVSSGGTSLTVVSPAGAAGVVDVRVNTVGGLSNVVAADKFTYGTTVCAGPVITSITPVSGPSTGGTSVTINGYGFTGATSVTFGGVAATFTFYTDTQIIATSPAGTLGTTVDVRVITPQGVSPDTTADNFTYGTAVPTVTLVSPASGTINGGTTVTITGTGFVVGGTTVTFGGTAGTSVSVTNSTTLTVVTPAKASGQVDVIVTTSNGSSVVSSASKYTYTGGTTTFTLSFRWTLVVWTGADGMTVANAVSGNDGSSATNDLTTQITLIARWSPSQQKWELSFPAQAGVPGANDFSTLSKGTAYFVAIAGPGSQSWTILLG